MRNITLKLCAMLLAICTSTFHLQAMDEWDGKTIAQGFYSGTGTKADPYRIFTASQFLYFLQQTKDGNTFSGQYIELCNDIAFKSNEGLVEGGDFYGDFDGNDHTIQVNKYWEEYYDYIAGGWHLFNLYGSMHDVLFIRPNRAITIYTEGILYNCKFEFPGGLVSGSPSYTAGYHGNWVVCLNGGTIANCVSNEASWINRLEQGGSDGIVSKYGSNYHNPIGNCLNCYFPIQSYNYGGGLAENYHGTIVENCGTTAGNDWVQNHTEYDYKSWPFTFNPTYPEYQIKEQPQPYNPSVMYTHSDEALYQWCYQKSKPITFDDIKYSTSTQTKSIVIEDNAVLSFDFIAYGYTYTGYNDGTDQEAWISVNGEKIVSVYKEKEGTYSCEVAAGTCDISCMRSDITNIRITYPTENLTNETSNTLSKQTIIAKPGVYFCQVSYGEGCDVMYSDYVDYEKLLTIDNVTYLINDNNTATVLWIADKTVDVTIPQTIKYNDTNYPITAISSKAFIDCTSLVRIRCKTQDVPALLGGTTFEGLNGESITSNATLYVPNDCVSTYAVADGWKDFSKIIESNVDLVDGQTFSNIENEVMDRITYTRTLPNLHWNALYVPFELPYEVIADRYEVAYINAVHSYDNNDDGTIDELSMEVMKIKAGTLQANHPYLIKARNEAAKAMTISVADAVLYAAEENTLDCSSVYQKFEITGSYSRKSAEELKGSLAISIDGAWQPLATGTYLNPFRLYLTITNRGGSPVVVEPAALSHVRIIENGETTGILDLTPAVKKETHIYDLSGRRVLTPQKGQLYIVNGKKVVY